MSDSEARMQLRSWLDANGYLQQRDVLLEDYDSLEELGSQKMRRVAKDTGKDENWVGELQEKIKVHLEQVRQEERNKQEHRIAGLPIFIAERYRQMVEEEHPRVRLNCLFEVAELVLRWSSAVLIADLRDQNEDRQLPSAIVTALRDLIKLPSFGKWVSIARSLGEVMTKSQIVSEAAEKTLPELWAIWTLEEAVEQLNPFVSERNRHAHYGAPLEWYRDTFADRRPTLENLLDEIVKMLAKARLIGLHGIEAADLKGDKTKPLHSWPEWAKAGEHGVWLELPSRQLKLWPLLRFEATCPPKGQGTGELRPQGYVSTKKGATLTYLPSPFDTISNIKDDEFRRLFGLDLPLPSMRERFLAQAASDAGELVGRTAEIAKARDWLETSGRAAGTEAPVGLLLGGPGMGKSMLIARLVSDWVQDNKRESTYFHRFRAGSEGNSPLEFFTGLIEAVRACPFCKHSDPDGPEGQPFERAKKALAGLAGQTESPRLTVMIDGLDEVVHGHSGFLEQLCELVLPGTAWLIASRDEGGIGERLSKLPGATRIFDHAGGLPGMSIGDIREMLMAQPPVVRDKLLRRDVDEGDEDNPGNPFIDIVIEKSAGNPLYIKFVSDDLECGKYEVTNESQLPTGLSDYFQELMQRLAATDVARALPLTVALLACAEEPLSRESLGYLNGTLEDSQIIDEVIRGAGAMLRFFHTPEGEEGFALYHTHFREHVLASDSLQHTLGEARKKLVEAAANWVKLPDGLRCHMFRQGTGYALAWGGNDGVMQARGRLTNFDYLMARLARSETAHLGHLNDEYRQVEARLALSDWADFRVWQRFMQGKLHVLRRGCASWPADRILLQFAVEHADDSPVTIAAERWLEEGKCDWTWLRNIGRPALMPPDPCLAVLEDIELRDAMVLKSGGILLLSSDGFLFRWEGLSGKPPFPIKGQNKAVGGLRPFDDGRILSWSDDGTMCIWDGKSDWPKVPPKIHAKPIRGVRILDDGRILSWSEDRTLCLWDGKSDLPQVTMIGHTAAVAHAEILKDGRVLSWSPDKTLRIWSGHPDSPGGTAEPIWSATIINQHMILTWTSDKYVRIWDGHAPKPLKTIHVLPEPNPFAGPELFWTLELENGNLEWHGNGTSNYLEMPGSANDSSELLGKFETVKILDDGRIISLSNGSVFLWDISSGAPSILDSASNHFTDTVGLADGHILCLSGFTSSNLLLWDGKADRPPLTMQGHNSPIEGAKILDDGRILSWSWDKTLCIWDGKSDRPEVQMKGHTESVRGARVFDDGRILSWSGDGTLCIWDGKSDRPQLTMEGHNSPIEGAKILDDGRILSWSAEGALCIWDGKSTRPTVEMEGHVHQISGARVLDDVRILSWSLDRTLRIWDSKSNRPQLTMEGHNNRIDGATFLDDMRIVFWSNTGTETLSVWSGKPDEPPVTIMDHTGRIHDARPLAEGRFLFWSYDETLRVWNGSPNELPVTIMEHTGRIHDARPLADGRFLFGLDDKTLRVWNGRPDELPVAIMGRIDDARPLADGRIIFWSDDETLRVWNGSPNELPVTIMEHTGCIDDARPLADGRIIFWSDDETLRVWNGSPNELPVTIMEHTGCIDDARPLADGRIIFWSDDETLRVWNGSPNELPVTIMEHTGRIHDARPLADGRIIFWSDDETLRVWNGSPNELPVTIMEHTGRIHDARPLADGRIIFWSDDETLRVWNGSPNELPVTIMEHTGRIERVRPLVDGRILVLSDGKTLRLCDGSIGNHSSLRQSPTNRVESSKAWLMPKGACVLLDLETGAPEMFVGWLCMRPLPRQHQTVAWLNDSPDAPVIFGYKKDLLVISTIRSFRFLRLMQGNHPGSMAEAPVSNAYASFNRYPG